MPMLSEMELVIPFSFHGQAAQVDASEAPAVCFVGPAGTGKTRSILEKLHRLCGTYPNIRALIVRKTLASLKTSALITFDEKVNPLLDGVVFRGDTAKRPPQYVYPNGSTISIGGMDRPGKVMSSEYDIIYVVEATELDEADYEALTTRLRNGALHYQQIVMDCNPDAPDHWLRRKMDAGNIVEYTSYHEDNPMLYQRAANTWTPEGERYLAILDQLTGVRYARYRLNQWIAAEGMIYQDSWDRSKNMVNAFAIPREWPRFLVIDFGFTNPFVCQWYAVDPDGRLVLYREIYRTQRLVEDHCKDIIECSGWLLDASDAKREPLPQAIICDHDAEDRATLERHLLINGRRLTTTAAQKAVSTGIQAVASRMRVAGDGKPRLMIFHDAVIARDPLLIAAKKPTCTAEEVPGYVWNTAKDAPVKEDDHGLDCLRYGVMSRDGKSSRVSYAPSPFAR